MLAKTPHFDVVCRSDLPAWVLALPTMFAKSACAINPLIYTIMNASFRKQAPAQTGTRSNRHPLKQAPAQTGTRSNRYPLKQLRAQTGTCLCQTSKLQQGNRFNCRI